MPIKWYALINGVLIPIFIILIGVFARRIVAGRQLSWREWVIGIELLGVAMSLAATVLLEMACYQLNIIPTLSLPKWRYLGFVFILMLSMIFLLVQVNQYAVHLRTESAASPGNPHPLSFPRMLWINFVGASPLMIALWIQLA